MDEETVRRIVREELDQRDAARREAAEISGSMLKVTTEVSMTKMIDDLELPDAEREKLMSVMNQFIGGMGLT